MRFTHECTARAQIAVNLKACNQETWPFFNKVCRKAE